MRDLTKYAPVWRALVRVPGVSIEQTYFDHSKRPQFQAEARLNAVRAAKQKAAALAEALGCNIGQPRVIDEAKANYAPMYNNSNVDVERPSDERTGGKLTVVATVEVEFELQTFVGGK